MKIDSRRRILVLSRKSIRNRLSRITESGTGEPREGARDRQSNEIGNSFAFFLFSATCGIAHTDRRVVARPVSRSPCNERVPTCEQKSTLNSKRKERGEYSRGAKTIKKIRRICRGWQRIPCETTASRDSLVLFARLDFDHLFRFWLLFFSLSLSLSLSLPPSHSLTLCFDYTFFLF